MDKQKAIPILKMSVLELERYQIKSFSFGFIQFVVVNVAVPLLIKKQYNYNDRFKLIYLGENL